MFFYNTVVAQAYRVDVTPEKITFTFLANQKVPRQQCEDMRAFLEDVAQKVSGQKIPVAIATAEGAAEPSGAGVSPSRPAFTPGAAADKPDAANEAALRDEAMADPSVQALFEIFPVEKSKVEEM